MFCNIIHINDSFCFDLEKDAFAFLYSPKTRWNEIFKVAKRFKQLFPVLIAEYKFQSEESASGSASGRLRQMTNIRLIHMVHLIEDGFAPLAENTKANQDPDILICEFHANFEQLGNKFSTMQAIQGDSEIQFWSRTDLKANTYTVDNHDFKIWYGGSEQNAKKGMKNDKEQFYEVLKSEQEKYSPTKESPFYHMRIFDVKSIPQAVNARQSWFVTEAIPSLRWLHKWCSSKKILKHDPDSNKLIKYQTDIFPLDSTENELLLQFSNVLPDLAKFSELVCSTKTAKSLQKDIQKENLPAFVPGSSMQNVKRSYTHADYILNFWFTISKHNQTLNQKPVCTPSFLSNSFIYFIYSF